MAGALDGRNIDVTKQLEAAAIGRLVAEERRGLTQRVEPELLAAFGRRLDDGGADQVLAGLRPTFEDASLASRALRHQAGTAGSDP